MKSLVIIGPAHPYRGGIASFNERLAKEFQNQGWKVTIFTFTLQYPKLFFPGKDQYHDGVAPENIEIKRSINSVNPFSWVKTSKTVNNLNPDLVITHFWHAYLGPALGYTLRHIKAKTISIVHNVFPHEPKPGDKILSKYFFRSSDGFIALSKQVKKDLAVQVKGKTITFSPHPIYDSYGEAVDQEVAKNKLSLNQNKKYILFFGLIRAYKGLDLLIEAFAKFKKINAGTQLIIAGEFYEDQSKYLKQIQKLKLEDDIIIHNHFIPNEEVKYYFSACDLVAQTYHRATQSGIMQIAIHFEKPLLVTDVGGLKEMIQDGKHGYVCKVNPESIYNALKHYFENSNPEFTQNIKQLKTVYSWETFYNNIIIEKP